MTEQDVYEIAYNAIKDALGCGTEDKDSGSYFTQYVDGVIGLAENIVVDIGRKRELGKVNES